MKLRVVRYPRARALATWIRPLMASTPPFVSPLSKAFRMPSQCVVIVAASLRNGPRRDRFAQERQAVRSAAASALLPAVAKMSRSSSFRRKARAVFS